MRELELTKTSIGGLLTLIEEQPGGLRHLFRGQGDAKWGLVPPLYRINSPNVNSSSVEKNYSLYEALLINSFFREGLPYLPQLTRSYSNDRFLAQHFGVPTRFLDWSQDPLVALFFALETWDWKTDASLFMLMPDAHYLPEDVKGFGDHGAVAITPPAIDRRIPSQKSRFTVHPYGDKTADFVALDKREGFGNLITTRTNSQIRGFARVLIPRKAKRVLFQSLLGMGVDRRNLFPGLEGVGADLASRAKCKQIW